MEFDFTKSITKKRKKAFADLMIQIQRQIGFKVSSRGWCYIMEQQGIINKGQFNKIATVINNCRKEGYLPVDFVAEESSRMFSGVEIPTDQPLENTLSWMLRDVLDGSKYFTPDWWKGEKFYIQIVVEKIDLVTLFSPVCAQFHIPIANSKGWSSILQRAEYCKRFAEAEQMGLTPVLLYFGDHDPDGLRISDTIVNNLVDLENIVWSDGTDGFKIDGLIIDRFGLNYDLIIEENFTWIDNLVTGSDRDLSDENHKNHKMAYVQNYLAEIGPRKCEANVLVTNPNLARKIITEAIEKYLGDQALDRFTKKRKKVDQEYEKLLKEFGLHKIINDTLDKIDEK